MPQSLEPHHLALLINNVFQPGENDRQLLILIDLPDDKVTDHPKWLQRREMALDWARKLQTMRFELGLEGVHIACYGNVHNNNADLPVHFALFSDPLTISGVDTLSRSEPITYAEDLFLTHQIILAPTEFSTTAPLKLMAKKYGFRAATMPGFTDAMIPALQLNYQVIQHRVDAIKTLLDPAVGMHMHIQVDDAEFHHMYFDLRFRTSHNSSGRFPKAGMAGNLPSGECYIVPYEGEKQEKSQTAGILPVQFGEDLVLYRIDKNRAVNVLSHNSHSDTERQKIAEEPAYANIAEIGFGILRDFGVMPTGEMLLDEKLGLHIAFGRSDHFGGFIGVKDFSHPDNVVHIDRIYIPEIQNRIRVNEVKLVYPDNEERELMREGMYVFMDMN